MRIFSKPGARFDTGFARDFTKLYEVTTGMKTLPDEAFKQPGQLCRATSVFKLAAGHSLSCVIAKSGLNLLAVANGLTIHIVVHVVVSLDGAVGVADCVANTAHSLFNLALYLLGSAVGLSLGIAGPLADLAFGAACCVVDRAFYVVAIHISTSVGPELRSLGCKKRAHSARFLIRLNCVERGNLLYSAALRPLINWMTRTTNASTSRMWMNPPIV
jgi:hypothetical protein